MISNQPEVYRILNVGIHSTEIAVEFTMSLLKITNKLTTYNALYQSNSYFDKSLILGLQSSNFPNYSR